ncbi:MAG: hypothetical protein IJ309_07175 [Clostridia bacterium]|nr:hypothetical protein [Clostridia bacterium]
MKPDTSKIPLFSLILSILFAIGNLFLGFYTGSWWFVTLGAYYVVLSVLRFANLQIKRQGEASENKFARKATGIMLMLLSLCLGGTVVLSVVTDRGMVLHEIVMISIATYAFTKITLSIIGLVRSRKLGSDTVTSLGFISFADSLASIFALQRSMLVSFDGMSESEIQLFNLLTGTGVSLGVLALGIILIVYKKAPK